MTKAKWSNGKRTVTGSWVYSWGADRFHIELDVRDIITGARTRSFEVSGETPEWGKFKLVRE